jgi:hypothetical protein
MNNKNDALQHIRAWAAMRLITRDELNAAFDAGAQLEPDTAELRQPGLTHILSYVGGAIVFLGISVLIWQHWTALSDATKILSTLGSGIAAYLTGVLLSRMERFEITGVAFHFIAALVSPLGLYVTLDVAGLDANSHGIQSLIAGILLTTYLLSYVIARKPLFTLFSIMFGTWLFFSFTSHLVGTSPAFGWEFDAYRVLCIGLVYGLLGYGFADTGQRALTGSLYAFGAFFFLGAALALGDWKPHQNQLWELAFPGLVFGVIFLSVHLHSKSFLTFGSIYLMAYLLKITAEYFAESLGWPLALVLTGLGLIAIGYLHVSLRKRFLPHRS